MRTLLGLLIALAVLGGLGAANGGIRATSSAFAPPVPVGHAAGSRQVPAQGTPTPPSPSTPPPTATCGPGAAGPWASASPAPQALDSPGVASDGTYIYSAGGWVPSTPTAQFSRYDPVANSWVTLTPLPQAIEGAALVYAPNTNKLYTFGGDTNPAGLNTTQVYDPAASTWSAGPNMPGPRTYLASGYWEGMIYLVGGGATRDFFNAQIQTWEYNPLANTWNSNRASLPGPRMLGGYGVLNGHFYVLGGTDGSSVTQTVLDYDIAANTWTTRTSLLPVAVLGAGSATASGRIWMMGGYNGAAVSLTQIYDPAADSWTGGPALNQARYLLGSTYAANYLVAIAGQSPTGILNTVEVSVVSPGISCTSPTPTATPVPPTSTPTATSVPQTNTHTATPAPPTHTLSATPAPPRNIPSATLAPPSNTTTLTPTPPTSTFSATPAPLTATPQSTVQPATPTASKTPCLLHFGDVQPVDYFYTPVQYLACRGVVSGYADDTFRPYSQTTRAQMVKIVVLGFARTITTPVGGGYSFADAPPSFPFFALIETAAADGMVSGYACGGVGEPCDANHRPYFRPYANVTRGQLSKIVVLAAGWPLQNPPPPGTFEDVLPGSAFYQFVETAACEGIVSGYACGGPGEACDAQHRPYYRLYNNATRGQIAKIVYLSIMASTGCGLGR